MKSSNRSGTIASFPDDDDSNSYGTAESVRSADTTEGAEGTEGSRRETTESTPTEKEEWRKKRPELLLPPPSLSELPARIVGIQFSMLSAEEIRRNSVVEVLNRDTFVNNKPKINGLFDPRMGTIERGFNCPTDRMSYMETPGYFGHVELARPVFFVQHLKEIVNVLKCVCFNCSRLRIDKKEYAYLLDWAPEDRWDYVLSAAAKVKRCGHGRGSSVSASSEFEYVFEGCNFKQFSRIRVDGMNAVWAIWDNVKTRDEPLVSSLGASSGVDQGTTAGEGGGSGGGSRSTSYQMRMTPEMVLRIFQRISDDDVFFMGFSPVFSHPKNMICQVLPVPPPAVRPSVKHDANQRSEDDLTQIYGFIIRTNNDLKEKIRSGTPQQVIDTHVSFLQHYIASIASNKDKGPGPIAQRTGRPGRPLQCIASRLNGKTGRIRGNLMGKRVDYSARTVITADPNLSIRQLGIPRRTAMELSKPVVVNASNLDQMRELVRNGTKVYPGAKIVEKANGDQIYLRTVDCNKEAAKLQAGDTVHRHLVDGDCVLFNRQPSLHRMSMLGHVIKVMRQGDTFRMNVADTKPYNADFDGDEMNLHMPQTVAAEVELLQLAAVHRQIISPSSNAPIIGIFQDSLLGSFRMTRAGVRFSPRDAMNLLMHFRETNFRKLYAQMQLRRPPTTEAAAAAAAAADTTSKAQSGYVTNFEILSQITPPLSLKYKTRLAEDDETNPNAILEIENGEWRRGQIEKDVFGKGTRGLLQRIYNDFGAMACSNFIDNLQNVVTEYMKTGSYSVGISDLLANTATQIDISEAIKRRKRDVQELLERAHVGLFENKTAFSNGFELERQITDILNKATEDAGKRGREKLDPDNRFVNIVKCGSKGSALNIAQMVSCLGQSSIEGRRVQYGFDGRTLPHFQKFDDSPEARGFIESSFISGLTPAELFFHAMAGRIGLIDTAVKTSSTGYIQRKLIKGLEDLVVHYDMTVRNNMNKIIQFIYGEDGVDTTHVESQTLAVETTPGRFVSLMKMSIEDIYAHFDVTSFEAVDAVFTPDAASRFRSKKQRDELRTRCSLHIDRMIQARDLIVKHVCRFKDEGSIKAPVAFSHIIRNIQGRLRLNANTLVDLTPLEAFDLIEQNHRHLRATLTYAPPTHLFEIMYFLHLSPRDLLVVRRFHRAALESLLLEINLAYKRALVHPGEMVGVVAGQSLGEPTTQLTLNSFHSTGIAQKTNVTRGVPRIDEILRLAKTPKRQSLTVYLRPEDEDNFEKARQTIHMLEHTRLVDIVKSVQICFDPASTSAPIHPSAAATADTAAASFIEEDADWLHQFRTFSRMVQECAKDTSFASTVAAVANDDSLPASMLGDGVSRPRGAAANKWNASKWILRLQMDAETMLRKNITMDDVHVAIEAYSHDLGCAFTDYNADNLVFRIRVGAELCKPGRRKHAASAAAAAAAAAGAGMPIFVDPDDQTDEIYALNLFQDKLLHGVVLRGVAGLSAVVARKDTEALRLIDGKYQRRERWVLDTTGTNLMRVLALDFIDYKRTTSDNIKEVHNVLGVEAMRTTIHNEMVDVMQFSGAYTNSHHIHLLADRMCSTERLVSIFRTGILNDRIGPIAKASFEVHTECFLSAARHGNLDLMRGVSANVMVGQHGYFGTNAFQVVLDMDQVKKLNPPPIRTSTQVSAQERTQKAREALDARVAGIDLKNDVEYLISVADAAVPSASAAADRQENTHVPMDVQDEDIGL